MELVVLERVHLKIGQFMLQESHHRFLSLIVNYRASAVFHRNVIHLEPARRNA